VENAAGMKQPEGLRSVSIWYTGERVVKHIAGGGWNGITRYAGERTWSLTKSVSQTRTRENGISSSGDQLFA